YETLERCSRAIAAAKTLLAKRVEASGRWKTKGHSSAAEHLASISGRSLGAARGELETSNALEDLPATKEALLGGDLSESQGQVIANASKVNPQAEQHLIDHARKANHQALRDEARRAKAAADRDPEATHRRINAERRLSRHTDVDGTWRLNANGTVVDGSIIASELDRLTDQVFRHQRASGTRECRDAYAFDALTEMARRSASLRHDTGTAAAVDGAKKHKLAAPQHLALLRLDVEALWRGYVEGDELCEIAGLGPIPIEIAKTLLSDAVLKLVITRGVDVLNVTSLTRGPTQAMQYARLWTSPMCTVEDCTRTRVEHDHRWGAEYKDTRHTRLDELDGLCGHHHDLHTRDGWAMVPGTGKRPMVSPIDPRHPANAPPPATGPPRPTEPAPPHRGVTHPSSAERPPDLFGEPAA
ncbi:MAG: DUF222 domain-containing protein, partial [Acidimicrobiales bacterium]